MLFTSGAAQSRPEMRDKTHDAPSDQPSPPSQPKKRGPRAIGVVEFLPGGRARLVPVALWIDGRYYDASLYQANPAPMAIEPSTEYLGEDYGEVQGSFVITTARQVNGNWIADGQWKPTGSLDAKLAADAAKAKANQPPKQHSRAVMTGDTDEGPPVLHKTGSGAPGSPSSSGGGGSSSGTASSSAGASDSSSSSTKSTSTQASPPDTSGRPTLSRPGDTTAETTVPPAPSKQPAPPDDDPDRPTMRASKPAESSSSPSAAPGSSEAANDADPSRPRLQRGKPAKPIADDPDVTGATGRSSAAGKAAGSASGGVSPGVAPGRPMRSIPAVSDAGNSTSRSMLYSLGSYDRERQEQQMSQMALQEIRKFIAQHPAAARPNSTTISDFDLRSFDLDFSNSPTVVYTAKLPGGSQSPDRPLEYYVTIVARVDPSGEAQKIFSSVTNTTYLDAYPRMEIVGAVDADANGRGVLLFRQYSSEKDISYGLYRVFPYQLQKMFEGGSSM